MNYDYPATVPKLPYDDFLTQKEAVAESFGFPCSIDEVSDACTEFTRLIVAWLVEGGRRANFISYGMHKTVSQLELIRIITGKVGGRGLIVLPLGVTQEFVRDARQRLGWAKGDLPQYINRIEQASETGIYLTNYETIRDLKMDPHEFSAVTLDEAARLRGFGGSKTFRNFMALFTADAGPGGNRRSGKVIPFRFVATATPSPQEYIELLAYAAFLGIMDVSQAKTRFFKRDSTQADNLTLLESEKQNFWLWVASWAVFAQKPSDLGEYSDEGYILPPLDIHWHEIPSDHTTFHTRRSGQLEMYPDTSISVSNAAKEKRDSLPARIDKMMELRRLDPDAHRVIWHHLEAERHAIEKAIPDCVTVYGQQKTEDQEAAIIGFSDGEFQEIAGKPSMIGSGTNLQRHCSWAIFLGIDFKTNDFMQAIHRLQRFGQTKRVRVDFIYTEAERKVRSELERRWAQHDELVKNMTDIIKQYGLGRASLSNTLARKMGVERVEVKSRTHRLVNWDSVREARQMESESVGLIATSIPFSTQYEYSPNFADFGHSDNNETFWDQMDYLIPELRRVLQPGRLACIHVKDRVIPMGLSGAGSPTVYPFHMDTHQRFVKHGFDYMGMITVATDVVRENNQTYRLGYTAMCEDGSRIGVGMPEYIMLFRRPPTDTHNSFADNRIVKSKRDYSLARWQVDAHAFWRSSGDRLMDPAELRTLKHDQIFKIFRDYQLNSVYNFEHSVRIGEELQENGRLPVTFMLLQPQSIIHEVWTDITRMLTLNGAQSAKGKENHLCPMQFDIADRLIERYSNVGDNVFDPFAGLGTVPYRAVRLGRFGIGSELSSPYFLDSVGYCRAMEESVMMPSLFDTLEDPVSTETALAALMAEEAHFAANAARQGMTVIEAAEAIIESRELEPAAA